MDNKKLKVKDLVSIGVFGVIYFAFMFGVGMMGLIPILFLIYDSISHSCRNCCYVIYG